MTSHAIKLRQSVANVIGFSYFCLFVGYVTEQSSEGLFVRLPCQPMPSWVVVVMVT